MISNSDYKFQGQLSDQFYIIFLESKEEIFSLANPSDNIRESVHLIRKHLKFLRALVKLTQFCSGQTTFREINGVLRDSGRLISGCRDAHVRSLLLDEFKESKVSSSFFPLIEDLTVLNDRQITKLENDLFSKKNLLKEVVAHLSTEKIASHFSSLQPDSNCLFSGHVLAYQKNFHAFSAKRIHHNPELLHEWRKRSKDLQYQQKILVECIPGGLPYTFNELTELCEMLGRINDLNMFSDWMNRKHSIFPSVEIISSFSKEIEHELYDLQKKAEGEGKSLYRLNPDEFRKKFLKQTND